MNLQLKRSALFRRPAELPFLCIRKSRHLEVVRQLELGVGVALEGEEVDQQRVLDSEDGVVLDVLAAAVEDLRDDGLVAWGGELDGCQSVTRQSLKMYVEKDSPRSGCAPACMDACPAPSGSCPPVRRTGWGKARV